MAKKNRIHENYRLDPKTVKAIKKYAKLWNVSEGMAVDCMVALIGASSKEIGQA